jgi:hypothetical protein
MVKTVDTYNEEESGFENITVLTRKENENEQQVDD